MWAVPSQSPVSPHSIASSETAARREAVQPAGIVFDPDNEAEKRNVDTLWVSFKQMLIMEQDARTGMNATVLLTPGASFLSQPKGSSVGLSVMTSSLGLVAQ